MNITDFLAFTSKYNGRIGEIITDIGVSVPFVIDVIRNDDSRIYRTKALWDTGATNCVITKQTAKELNLKPTSIAKVQHAGGVSMANVYLVNIFLPNNMMIPTVRVTECADNIGSFGVIIGMDVITIGDFAITNKDQKTTVSFRIPSVSEIDYVKDADMIKKSRYKSVGRNDLCPCGSKKKYKHCHGKQ